MTTLAAFCSGYGVSVDSDDLVTVQEALRQSERELQQLIDALPVHIWSCTPKGDLAYVSKQVAFDLGISELTVKLHRANVMRKMQAASISQLIRIWESLPFREAGAEAR